MKKVVGIVAAAVLAVGSMLVAPSTATAVPSGVVTSTEFYSVAPGNSIEFVRKTFGSNGKVLERHDGPGTRDDFVSVGFPTYYDEGEVVVDFARRSSGTWYLVTKYALWGNSATRTADKATPAEFNRIKQGNSITYVRSTFGTNGTITEYLDAPGTEYDGVVVEWPTASVTGWAQVYFTKNKSGTWVVDTRSAYWDLYPAQVANKATEPEFNRVKAGNSIDHARSTFGSIGTIDYYYDAPGTADDVVRLMWPVASADGWVVLDFTKSSSTVWKVDYRQANWARTAEPTVDVVTQEAFDAIRVGSTLDDVRRTFGSAGTVVYYEDGPGADDDVVDVAWYTGAPGDDIYITFWKVAGAWTILREDEISSPWVSITPLNRDLARGQEATEEESEPAVRREHESPARPIWDLRAGL